ncbi:hypothetical protein [Xylophilus sp. GOD-11R]|uniref:hypothetical protein n=1 Tax=Xylophilus sp. GOD-11R TaxID=3089814 RepID=UPI00298C524D|nr:hypothetical protein [Xylophilus sp. GOD-11R]WPB58630.1 hypothetical protein R9X41_08340 [Xylophilus sp. GOD-11R]
MKIGVICEGLTDFHAINHYLGAELHNAGIQATFISVQPNADNTSGGGWGNVLGWLDGNPLKERDPLFEQGLFANSRRLSGLDSILIHLDTDILPDQSFVKNLKDRGYVFGSPQSSAAKCTELTALIHYISLPNDASPRMKNRHIPAPIAESSEAWCVAVDTLFNGSAEALAGQALANAFGTALARYKNISPQTTYKNINKSLKTREDYCKNTKGNLVGLATCAQFVSIGNTLKNWKFI